MSKLITLLNSCWKEHTRWPSPIAEQRGPKSYVVVLNDGRVWKRHVDRIRRNTMDSGVSTGIDKESGNTFPNPVQKGAFGAGIPVLDNNLYYEIMLLVPVGTY